KVEAELVVAPARDERDVVNRLEALDGGLARAEVVAPDAEFRARAGADDGLGLIRVGLARLLVARELEARLVDHPLRERRGQGAAEGVALNQAVAGVLLGGERAVVLVVHAVEALVVVAQRELVVPVNRDVGLAEEDVL